jgi:hypothetical protein
VAWEVWAAWEVWECNAVLLAVLHLNTQYNTNYRKCVIS